MHIWTRAVPEVFVSERASEDGTAAGGEKSFLGSVAGFPSVAGPVGLVSGSSSAPRGAVSVPVSVAGSPLVLGPSVKWAEADVSISGLSVLGSSGKDSDSS